MKLTGASRRRFLALGAAMPALLTPAKEAATDATMSLNMDAVRSPEFYECLKANPKELGEAILEGLESANR